MKEGRLEQYLADFAAAVSQAQLIPFLYGRNDRQWRATLDWFIANDENVYRVLEGKYGQPVKSREQRLKEIENL